MSELFSGIAPLHYALDYHMERHNVLASNIAHVDTPGYRPQDLERTEPMMFQNVLNVELKRTNSAHVDSPAQAGVVSTGRLFDDLNAGAGQDGNYVSLDREASKLAANNLRFDVVSTVVAAELRQLAFAANDGRG
jgi:flagellar basal-body rod protein FlgB